MPSRSPRALLALTCLGLVFLGGSVYAASGAAAKPGITLLIAPASQSVPRGTSAAYTVSVTSIGGFSGPVALAASGVPGGSTAAFAPSAPTPPANGTATSTLTVSTSSATPVGAYQIAISGSSGAGNSKVSGSVTAGLTVNYPLSGSLVVSATPASVTVDPGSVAAYTVQVTPTNITSPVALAVAGGPPSGVTAAFSPNPLPAGSTTRGSTLQVTTSATVPDGTYPLNLVASGTDAGGTQRFGYAAVQLVVKTSSHSFTIAGAPAGALAPGVSQPINVAITNPNNKPLSVSGLSVAIGKVVKAVHAPNGPCTTADYLVTQYGGAYPVQIAANSTQSLSDLGIPRASWPKLQMVDAATNQDGCKGATLSLSYSGSGQGN